MRLSARLFRFEVPDADGGSIYSTYLGTGCDTARKMALDASGNVWITGQTNSTQFPQVMSTEPGPAAGQSESVVSMLDSSGAALGFSSFLAGANAIAIDRFGNVYIGGSVGGHALVAMIQM